MKTATKAFRKALDFESNHALRACTQSDKDTNYVVHNVYRFQILKFTYVWHKGLLPKLFANYFKYAVIVHKYNTRYASKQNLYVKKVRTNTGKQTIGYAACTIWDKIPITLKELNTYQFQKQLKPYLLSEQHS